MCEIYIDIYKDSLESITTIQGNNDNKLYKLIITDNKVRINLTNKSVKMAYINTQQRGDIIDGLEISNAVEGEITLPITNVLTKQDGIYGCQLAIYNSNGFLEHTGAFSLIVKENLFNKVSSGLLKTTTYQKLTSILEHSEEMAKNLADAKEVNVTLEGNISAGKVLNNSLSSHITTGNNINGSLISNSLTAGEKNTELNKSLEETKKFIDGLDGSQNIPQIRMEVTELQNGLKNNQALEYEGTNLTCENTYDGRTEGMRIEGIIYQNLFIKHNEFSRSPNGLSSNIYNK
ncbi:MAG: BppU family phage baseplate upper protein, partial [Clostridium sp.]|uniref:BppU family phage baseplate upper protein n=1 Tax=Clostridium sp. TaxID=1506 RepID=UPI003F3E2AF9